MRARTLLALALLAPAGFGTASCGDSSGPEESVVGYYLLKSVEHTGAVPVGVQITGGSVTLMANGAGSWSETSVAVVPNAIPHTESASGTYTREGNRVELVLPARTMSMVFTNGNTLTCTFSLTAGASTTYVYRK